MTNAGEQHVAVLGLGYVGCVTAACLAHIGHRVTGVDKDDHKVRSVLAGSAPFYEPGLEDLVRAGITSGRLCASTDVAAALDGAGIVLICVGTPSERNGNLGLDQLRRVCEELGRHLAVRSSPLVVAVRSTVFPGTCEDVVVPALGDSRSARVVSNPEFLREGSAVKDFLEPSLTVVGGDDPAARELVASLYSPLGADISLVSLRTAEMIKYSCNAFHAVKIGFANEVGALCGELGISAAEVMQTLCRDVKLNISPAYLKPGFAFGGSCLPKDLRALVYRAGRLDLKLPLLESVLPANEQHLRRSMQRVMDIPAARIGVFGLAFKENTDDLRESPVVTLLEHCIGKGRDIRVFDPHIRLDQIHGSNRHFILSAIPHIERVLAPGLDELLEWAEHLVIAQKPSPEMGARMEARAIGITNLVE